jgi:predicted N-formylglutamate amidohydrolase
VSLRGAAHDAFVITCEHGGNRIPAAYRSRFREHKALLATHRGYDIGALVMAKELAKAFHAPLVTSTVSRLLVDLNRSIAHPSVFSDATRDAPKSLRARIVAEHYLPYRLQVEGIVEKSVSSGLRVIHISSHSFTPELNGKVRTADVGLLYDPARFGEVALCSHWKASLASRARELRVRRNYPYAGKGDGLTLHLRRRFSPRAYVGVELEVNQRIVLNAGAAWISLRRALVDSLRDACAS